MKYEWTESPEWVSQSRYIHASKNDSYVGGFKVTIERCEEVIEGIPLGYNERDFDLRDMGGFWIGPIDLPANGSRI